MAKIAPVVYSFEEKVKIVNECQQFGLVTVLPRYKLSYKGYDQIKREVEEGKTAPSTIRKDTTLKKLVVTHKIASSILTAGKGFMSEYDYTLNPYSGCAFGCNYCYAAFFSRSEELANTWGHWLTVKDNAVELLVKFRKKDLTNKSIYMSSVTDPYQPIERDLLLTRKLLEELTKYHRPRLVIQTRSPLVTRDIDLYKQLDAVQINMTVTTDSERVRKIFEPLCPSNALRLKAIGEIAKAGLNACITITPMLPIEDDVEFAKKLLSTGVKKFIIQPFHAEKGKFVASTGKKALDLINDLHWNRDKYHKVLKTLSKYLPEIGLGKDGFKPI